MVAVLPFAGHPAVRRSSGEWLAHRLHAMTRFTVLSPGFAEAKLSRVRASGGPDPSPQEVRELVRLLGARVVINGSIQFAERGHTPRVELRLVDVPSNEVLALVTEEAGFALGVHDPYELAQIALEQAAKKSLAALQEKGGPDFQAAIMRGDGVDTVTRPSRGYRFRFEEGADGSPCGYAGSRPDVAGACR